MSSASLSRHEADPVPTPAWQPALALLIAAALLAAAFGGLHRAGLAGPMVQGSTLLAQAASAHAMLMFTGFLGSLIAIRHALAVQRLWAFAAPVAAITSAVLLVAGQFEFGALLGLAAALAFFAIHVTLRRRRNIAYSALMLLAALAWLMGNALYASGASSVTVLPWWFAMPILSIVAERLVMSGMMRRHPTALPLLMALVPMLLGGVALSARAAPLGGVIFGTALVALALWLAVFDNARRNMFKTGLQRYMAWAIIAGQAWLALGGLAWMGTALGCPGRDLALHALGLGFILSLVMGHAPVIVPAVARIRVHFSAFFYLPLLALHGSLLLRLVAGIGHPEIRSAGAIANAAALLVFIVTLAASARALRSGRSHA
jgi:hypothetical protein